ncbi:histamine H1 receptor [Pristis pectinata]|uniref:histamine H1 receptor n=1 Tax=Pristis pectinata TaxID=685728 RepID=UPI00223E0B21|nr:histamine H1 receptor [Pristis pectinata]
MTINTTISSTHVPNYTVENYAKEYAHQWYPVMSILLALALSFISLLTAIMNVLVLYVVKRERKLHNIANMYIVNLSLADLFVGMTVMPLSIIYMLENEWKLGRVICQFWLSMDYVNSTASIFSLFILSVDWYHSVLHPLRYLKYRTRTRAVAMIAGAWLLSLTWLIPILGWHSIANRGIRTVANNKFDTEFRYVIWFKILTAALNFYAPSILMLWCYAKIYMVVRKHCQQRDNMEGLMNGTILKNNLKQSLDKCEIGLNQQASCIFIHTAHPTKSAVKEHKVNPQDEKCGISDIQTFHKMHHQLSLHPEAKSWADISEKVEGTDSISQFKQLWQRFSSQSVQFLIIKERKAIKQLGFIVAAFMVCWILYFVIFMIMAFCDTCVSHNLHMVTIWLGYINSTLNPFIYALCNKNIKKSFKAIIHFQS